MATALNDTAGPGTPMPVRPFHSRPRRVEQVIKLPPAVRLRLRACAAFLDVEISELSEVAITRYLDELDRDRGTRGETPLPRPGA